MAKTGEITVNLRIDTSEVEAALVRLALRGFRCSVKSLRARIRQFMAGTHLPHEAFDTLDETMLHLGSAEAELGQFLNRDEWEGD